MKVYELMSALAEAEAGAEVVLSFTGTPADLMRDPSEVDTENGEITVDFSAEDAFHTATIILKRA